eukprot:1161921-Pelagomonas_calceolata.AAC.7
MRLLDVLLCSLEFTEACLGFSGVALMVAPNLVSAIGPVTNVYVLAMRALINASFTAASCG